MLSAPTSLPHGLNLLTSFTNHRTSNQKRLVPTIPTIFECLKREFSRMQRRDESIASHCTTQQPRHHIAVGLNPSHILVICSQLSTRSHPLEISMSTHNHNHSPSPETTAKHRAARASSPPKFPYLRLKIYRVSSVSSAVSSAYGILRAGHGTVPQASRRLSKGYLADD
jgi:hypothetical protein